MTQLLLDELSRKSSSLETRHVDMSVSRQLQERERFRWHKLATLARQAIAGMRLARRGYDAYYPISQTRTGLIRDVALLLPYWVQRRGIVIHLHGGGLPAALDKQPWWLRRSVRTLLATPRTSGIVLTPSLRSCLRGLVSPERIAVVANAVRVPHEDAVPLASTDRLRVVYLSSLLANKGYRELIGAVTSLASRDVPITLDVAGEPFTSDDRDWLRKNASHPSVRMFGQLDNGAKWKLLWQAHCLALPVLAPEGQPLAILEGMAAGCAILSTDWGGVRETVGPDAGVILERLHGPALQAALADVLARWAGDIDGVTALGQRGRGRWESSFSPDRFIATWLQAIGAVTVSDAGQTPT